MKRVAMIVLCMAACLWLARASDVSSDEGGWNPPSMADLPPDPWRSGHMVWAAGISDDDVEFREIRVRRDTFVASNWPFDWKEFGEEETTQFGTHAVLGHVRALLEWPKISLSPYDVYLGAAVYLPIVGQDPVGTLDVSLYKILGDFREDTTNWHNQPSVSPEPFSRLTIGDEYDWYWFDVSDMLHFDRLGRGEQELGIELRGPETSQNMLKGMWAREAGPEAPVPLLVVAYLPDVVPPMCSITGLPPVSPGPVRVSCTCSDEQSGVARHDLQYRGLGEDWGSHTSTIGDRENPAWSVRLQGGGTYEFRVRAHDWSGNTSEWTSSTSTTVESVPPVLTVLRTADWVGVFHRRPDGINYTAEDPGPISSGIYKVEIAYMDTADGVRHEIGEWKEAVLQTGHQYTIWGRARDNAYNRGEWLVLSVATAYERKVSGRSVDVLRQSVQGLRVGSEPSALYATPSDSHGDYQLLLASREAHTISPLLPEMMRDSGREIKSSYRDEVGIDFQVRVLDDRIVNGKFEQSLAGTWMTQGRTATLDMGRPGGDGKALRLGTAPEEFMAQVTQPSRARLVLGKEGSQHIVWLERTAADGPQELFYIWRPSAGTDWSEPAAFGLEHTAGTGDKPKGSQSASTSSLLFEHSAEGTMHLLYEVEYSPGTTSWFLRTRSPSGVWTSAEALTLPNVSVLDLFVDAGGSPHVVLRADDQDSKAWIEYSWRDVSGEWIAPTRIDQILTDSPARVEAALLVTDGGIRHVAWFDPYGADGILAHRSSANGKQWSAPEWIAPDGPGIDCCPELRTGPGGELVAFWLRDSHYWTSPTDYYLYYSQRSSDTWGAAQTLMISAPTIPVHAYDVALDKQGNWRLLLQPDQYTPDRLYSGASLVSMEEHMRFPRSSCQSQIGMQDSTLYVLRCVLPVRPRPIQQAGLTTVELGGTPDSVIASQVVSVPYGAPVVQWDYAFDSLLTGSDGGQLQIGVSDEAGWHEIASVDESVDPVFWASLSPWSEKAVTLTLRFDPRGDPTAWVWVDDVRLTALPINTRVQLKRGPRFAEAGEELIVKMEAANQRLLDLDLPLELAWPTEWNLVNVTHQPVQLDNGVARFSLPVTLGEVTTVELTLQIPAGTPRSAHAVTARFLEPVTNYDYTPHDNEDQLDIIVDPLLVWMPLIES